MGTIYFEALVWIVAGGWIVAVSRPRELFIAFIGLFCAFYSGFTFGFRQ